MPRRYSANSGVNRSKWLCFGHRVACRCAVDGLLTRNQRSAHNRPTGIAMPGFPAVQSQVGATVVLKGGPITEGEAQALVAAVSSHCTCEVTAEGVVTTK